MKIATYNVNGIKSRLPTLLKWLKMTQPDIVCLQELKTPQSRFPQEALRNIGYYAIWASEPRWNGVAILSKKNSLLQVIRQLPNTDDQQCRFIEAVANNVRICCIYAPNGNPYPSDKFYYKLRWYDYLQNYIQQYLLSSQPTILAGDFNIIPNEIDVFEPEKWQNDALFSKEVRAIFQKLGQDGWVDALRSLYPEKKIYTFYEYFKNAFKRKAGLRIDHFLLNPAAALLLESGSIEMNVRSWPKTSDHCPAHIILQNC